jgi:hypothetical protein
MKCTFNICHITSKNRRNFLYTCIVTCLAMVIRFRFHKQCKRGRKERKKENEGKKEEKNLILSYLIFSYIHIYIYIYQFLTLVATSWYSKGKYLFLVIMFYLIFSFNWMHQLRYYSSDDTASNTKFAIFMYTYEEITMSWEQPNI